MERVWIIVACALALVAAVLILRGRVDGAFATGALGLVAWFLSFRSRLTAANAARENASNESLEMEEQEVGEQDED